MSDENAEGTVENTETVEQLQERLRKAEAKIVDMKKSTTQEVKVEEDVKTESKGFDEDVFEKKYEEKKFFEANPDMLEYKDKLTEYTSKGIGYKEAKLLVENSDESIANRKVASQTNFTAGDAPNLQQTTYTQEELKTMPQAQYERVMTLKDEGKVTFT